jgi:hypothetical protein
MTTVKDGLYHKLLGFPARVLEPWLNQKLNLSYTQHARQAAKNDRYGEPEDLPETVSILPGQVIELEIAGGRLQKLVVRIPYDSEVDLCLVLSLETERASVKTLWLNLVTDNHSTLRRGPGVAYRRP